MSERTESAATPVCTLDPVAQRRNMILFACCTGLQYLAAPMLYVGITQAGLCEYLGANRRISNLPATLFFAMTAVPAVIAWASPKVSKLRRNLAICYAIAGVAQLLLATALALPIANAWKIGLVILQGGVSGAVMPAAIALLWEVIGRGTDERRRGSALGLAFGAGPVLAVVGSLGQSVLLGESWFGYKFPGVEFPTKYVVLFGCGGPTMFLAAALSQFFVIPPVSKEVQREPVARVVGLLLGVPSMFASVMVLQFQSSESSWLIPIAGYSLAALAAVALTRHFLPILRQRVLLVATAVTILVYAGNTIPSNMNLYTESAIGEKSIDVPGKQNALRFGFKVLAGTALGWMLSRTSPRAGILATSALFLVAQIWALCVTGPWYLLAFGIFGAGELIGVYAPNYMACASRTEDLRRNMAFSTMLMVPASPMGYVFGSIVDLSRQQGWSIAGMDPDTLGFRISFLLCALMILAGMVVTIGCLPAHPRQSGDGQPVGDAGQPQHGNLGGK
jgi:MFS family permease